MTEKEKIRRQVLRAELRRIEKMRAQREELNRRLGNRPLMIRGNGWSMTFDEYEEQESWLRKSPDSGKIEEVRI